MSPSESALNHGKDTHLLEKGNQMCAEYLTQILIHKAFYHKKMCLYKVRYIIKRYTQVKNENCRNSHRIGDSVCEHIAD